MQQDSDEHKTVVVKEKEAIHPWRWRFLFVCLLSIGVGFFLTVRDLRDNDAAIQKSRVESCIRNYGSFHDIFLPFFPAPNKRTARQKKDLAKLNATIKRLQARCPRQIELNK